MRVRVRPELLRWARERVGFSAEALARRIPQLPAWERGEVLPTLKQLEKFAKVTYAPVGYLLLSEPPVETVPILPRGRRVRRHVHVDDAPSIVQQHDEHIRHA